MKILFISDFYIDEIIGGAEICNDYLIQSLISNQIKIDKVKSINVTTKIINNYDFYIIANYFQLSQENKEYFFKYKNNNYVIYEHDHKYVSTNNPTLFPNFLIDEQYLINKNFYKNAKAVLAQSKIHSEIIQKNLLINNIVNLGSNIWDDKSLEILLNNKNNEKTIEYGILETKNKNKGMINAIEYCKKNNVSYCLIPFQNYENFIISLSKVKNLVFFPQWLETFSRVSVEAKILNCKLITNKLIGAASEEFFKFNSNDILDYIKKINIKIVNTFIDLINNKKINYIEAINLPKVSIITSLYKGSEFIEHFLVDITRQTIFHECELIILDANSPDNEVEIINKFCNKFKNIKYIKFDSRLNVHQTLNKGIEISNGEYITIANVDDRRTLDSLEVLRKHLFFNKNIDLVYGDCLVTSNKNEFVELCKSNKLYEHSVMNFTKENMIKCLPGPIPMWKKSMSINNGNFNESLKYAGDWEFWLRCVKNGSIFKKVNYLVGSYYYNPNGLSTSLLNNEEKHLEERQIFIDYKEVFGYNNFEKFREYFNV